MKTLLYALVILFASLNWLPLANADVSTAKDGTNTPAKTELILGFSADEAPYSYSLNSARPHGVMIELWQQALKHSRFTPVWRELSAADAAIVTDIDIVIGPVDAPEGFIPLTPLMTVRPHLYRSAELKGQSLQPYLVGNIQSQLMDKVASKQFSGIVASWDKPEDLLMAAKDGQVKAFIDLPGRYTLWRELGINLHNWISEPLQPVTIGAGLNPDKHYLEAELNQLLSRLSTAVIDSAKRAHLGPEAGEAELIIAAQTGISPYVDVGSDGQMHGLYVDLWRAWSEQTGIPIRFQPSSMQQSVKEVSLGLADVQIGYPQSDAERQPVLDTAWQIYGVVSRVFVPVAHQFNADGKGEVLGVYRTAPYKQALKLALPNAEFKVYESAQSMVDAVNQGEITGFVGAARWTESFMVSRGIWDQYRVEPDVEFSTRIEALVSPARQELKKIIADGFDAIPGDTLAAVESKWVYGPRDRYYAQQVSQISLNGAERRYLDNLGLLTVGYLQNWAPFEFASGNTMQGINAEVFKLVGERLGIGLQTRGYENFHQLQSALRLGEVQLIGSLQPTADRLRDISFTDSYWPSPWAVASQDDSTIIGLHQLAGRRVMVVEGYHLAAELMQMRPQVELTTVADVTQGLAALAADETDLVVGKLAALSWAIEQQESDIRLSLLTDVAAQRSHIGVNNQYSSLVPLINRALDEIESHELRRINEHWVTGVNGQKTRQAGLINTLILAASLLIALLLLTCWLRRDRKQEAQALPLPAGMIGRPLLDDRLSQAVLMHHRQQGRFAVFFVSVDGLSQIEDRQGREAANEAFNRMVARLRGGLRRSDTLARFSDRELVLILPFISSEEHLGQLAHNIQSLLTDGDPELEPGAIKVGIGIAFYPKDGSDPISLMSKAAELTEQALASGDGIKVA